MSNNVKEELSVFLFAAMFYVVVPVTVGYIFTSVLAGIITFSILLSYLVFFKS